MKSNAGFTLIELILVTVIIGILAGMVVMSFGGRLGDAQVKAAKGDIATYSASVDLYALDHNDTYPKTLNDLVTAERPYLQNNELRKDPWGNPYHYKPPSDPRKANYRIYSAGPDGTPDNADDVTSTSEAPK
jgi:general secretion pathway protein G